MKQQQLTDQAERGFRSLRFEPELEGLFRRRRIDAMRERAYPVAVSALALFFFYAFLDYATFPARLSEWTIPVRLLVTCPVFAAVLVIRRWRPAYFPPFYAFSYLWGGLSLVLLIGIARDLAIPMPYDGILLCLMFGYFLMGLSCRTATVISSAIVVSYVAMEWRMGTPSEKILYNSFFVVTAHIIGIVGAWLQEYSQRAHFLDSLQLEMAREQAEAESRRKTRFVAVASHDLRQPLHVINLLLANLNGPLGQQEQRRIFDQLGSSVDHLNHLLESLLDLSRLDEGMVKPVLESVNAVELMRRVAGELQEAAEASGVTLEVADVDAFYVKADSVLLRRILHNLVQNALQHAQCRRVKLSCHARGNRVILDVRDDGVGIAREDQRRLFEPFVQGGTTPLAERGLGLGLAIVHQLTLLMGGRCQLHSVAARGACFSIILLGARAPETMAVDVVRFSPLAADDIRVWVIEDHVESRRWVARLLEQWGYCPSCFSSAEEALAAEGASVPDLAIVDLHLGAGLDGWACLEHLRQRVGMLPAILVTADTACRQGFAPDSQTWLLHKPLSAPRLRAAISRLMAKEDVPVSP